MARMRLGILDVEVSCAIQNFVICVLGFRKCFKKYILESIFFHNSNYWSTCTNSAVYSLNILYKTIVSILPWVRLSFKEVITNQDDKYS